MSSVRRPHSSTLQTCRILDTGYCLTLERLVINNGAFRTIHCHSIVALLHHPEHGWTLFDTGYAPRMFQATRKLPYRLYRLLTPLRLRPHQSVAAQLRRSGVRPADIERIIVSHFHADHVGGLRDFPGAELIALRLAYEGVKHLRGFKALQRAFLPSLLPPDFEQRATMLRTFSGPPLPGLGLTHDLYGDGSVLLVELPGHARGQMGMLANTERGKVLFAADGCWLTRQVREQRPPHRLTNVLADDPGAVRTTIKNLHTFAKACPDVTIIPTHCPEAFARETGLAP